jgi:prepilin-type N-terminal cleavage/methylation domain-containing protein
MKSCPELNAQQDGYTLLEVMIALALLTVVGTAAAMLMLPILDEQNHTREVTRATGHTRAVIEELNSRTLEDLTNSQDGYLLSSNWPKKGRQVFDETPTLLEMADLTIPTLDVSVTDIEADPLEILVQVTWEGRDEGQVQHQFWVVRTR